MNYIIGIYFLTDDRVGEALSSDGRCRIPVLHFRNEKRKFPGKIIGIQENISIPSRKLQFISSTPIPLPFIESIVHHQFYSSTDSRRWSSSSELVWIPALVLCMEITYASPSATSLASSNSALSSMPASSRPVKVIPLQHPSTTSSSPSGASAGALVKTWTAKVKRMTWIQWMELLLPCSRWIRTYKWREYLQSDLLSGITIGIMLVPQVRSYSLMKFNSEMIFSFCLIVEEEGKRSTTGLNVVWWRKTKNISFMPAEYFFSSETRSFTLSSNWFRSN